ncbi:hypothetical protein [Natrononativus amylolyticus]|uniref:hypothetical protein n=1 Tax=Natrononativus amylolyticus TaxID=2963434 RepID=UPI0020CDE38C|nr:hypothetical protein [Natrononativus amylolyticus]
MQSPLSNLVVFMYNFGVVLSGGYVIMHFGIDDRFLFFGIMFVFALFWTAYFRYAMYDRLITLERGEPETTEG